MKQIISWLSVLVFSLFNLNLFAAPDMPVASDDQIREYALAVVVKGARSISAPSAVWSPDRPTSVEVIGHGAEDVLNQLLAKELVIGVINPADEINGQIWLYDSEGFCLWYGQSSYRADSKVGPKYNLWIQEIPLLEDVNRSVIYIFNEDKQTVGQQDLAVRDGHVMFPPWLAGTRNAVITVWFKNDEVVSWSLDGGSGEVPSTVSDGGRGQWKIEGHYIVPENDTPMVSLEFTATVLPTALIVIKENQLLQVDVAGFTYGKGGPFFERPTEIILTRVSDGVMEKAPLDQEEPTVFPGVNPGTYRVRFTFPLMGEGKWMYPPQPSTPVGGVGSKEGLG